MAMSKPRDHRLAPTLVAVLKTPGRKREGRPKRCKTQAHLGKRRPPLGTRPHIRGAEAAFERSRVRDDSYPCKAQK